MAAFPLLSCLNKDEMLSHTLTIKMGNATTQRVGATTKRSFVIGRSVSRDDDAPDFELNGMGIYPRHCKFEFVSDASGGGERIFLETVGLGAMVSVNGRLLEEPDNDDEEGGADEGGKTEEATKSTTRVEVKHLDRIILGPCRLVCLLLTKALSRAAREEWTHEEVFAEFNSFAEGGGDEDDEDEDEDVDKGDGSGDGDEQQQQQQGKLGQRRRSRRARRSKQLARHNGAASMMLVSEARREVAEKLQSVEQEAVAQVSGRMVPIIALFFLVVFFCLIHLLYH